MSNGYLGLWLHFVETLLQAISWVGLKELEEHLESVVDVWLVIQTYKQESKYVMRNEVMHEEQCQELEDCDLHSHFSVNCGLNYRSVSSKIKNFKVTDCLPFDVMHILLEGVITREIRLLLQHCFSQRYFTLETLNQQIKYVDLGYNKGKDRPTQITRDAIDRDDKLGQRAA
ncbi:uncharacterized protein LOC134198610 [Corticium candelabrum]|uniref:uncharacterized protein LOC134198610 n=1 Tax=Corticium candelabrum TaxID=121492 RepID=UPI002E27535E|nr:uncharacterized protein LOC134198610 [Corticium candelabrum]